jgi:rRNA maturation endonuclease Nob1
METYKKMLDYVLRLKICGNCGVYYPKEKDKCPQCGSKKLFTGKEVKNEKMGE